MLQQSMVRAITLSILYHIDQVLFILLLPNHTKPNHQGQQMQENFYPNIKDQPADPTLNESKIIQKIVCC
jgi:hypothetical protein